MKKLVAVALGLALGGCAVTVPKPTQVTESHQREFLRVIERTERPLNVSEESVVLDTRSSFDFGLNHVRNAQHFLWSNLTESEITGELLRDSRTAALRLALLGLTPETPVVVVGYGPSGHGEEGRLAWNLLYLGFTDVQVSAVEPLRAGMTQEPSPQAKNVPPWRANVHDDLQIGKNELLNLANSPRVHILDVRSAAEFAKTTNHYGAVNIEWKQFYTPQGRPSTRFKDTLIHQGIAPTDRVIVISNRGVRSAAAAYALLALGFQYVQNFTPGWRTL